MLFSSAVFIIFFLPLLFLCYFIIPQRWLPARNLVLLVFSLFFYNWGGTRYLGLLLASVVINYLGGLLVGTLGRPAGRKAALVAAVAVNLGLLGIFKYAGFAVTSLNSLGLALPVPQIVLPVGISFFTFQGMSYVIDVYRGDAGVQKNPLNVALYISLFPQLVAGPIVRYTQVEREITRRTHSVEDVTAGAVRFMLGFGKKMLMANAMGGVADKVFARVGTALFTTPLAWVGAIAYTFQIYYDFSAYSDMAIGLGRMFGFRFLENFNYPYIAHSVKDFWRRWHISLSSWFRDYVYIPMGGSRCSTARSIRNMAVVWLLTGLWHGAAWNFILWGVYYGVLLILERYVFRSVLERIPMVVRHLLTLLIIIVGWVFFRAENLAQAWIFVKTMFGAGGSAVNEAFYYLREYWPEFLICLVGMFPLKGRLQEKLPDTLCRAMALVFAFVVFGMSYTMLVSGSFNPFIYFQF